MTDQTTISEGQVWTGPDGPLYIARVYLSRLGVFPAAQDLEAGWSPVKGSTCQTVTPEWLRAECTYMPPPPANDARIVRLTDLVDHLLTEYQTAVGVPAAVAAEVRAALAEVAEIPALERRQRVQVAQVMFRSGVREASNRAQR
jgi:hypothetical protein